MSSGETATAVEAFSGDMDPGERRHAIAMWKQAQQLARSSLSGELRGKPEDVYAVIAFADQFGINAGNAIQMVWIIKGRIVPRSEFLAAVCRRAGHELRFEESSSERCTVAIRRRGDDYWQRVTFTIEDAARAKLTDKEIWRLFAADMLCHATVRRAVKRICPDVLLGVDLGGDDGIDAGQYRPLETSAGENVVDVALDWDEETEPDAAEGSDGIEDAEVVGDGEAPDREAGVVDPSGSSQEGSPSPTHADRDKAMKRLMATCGKAFPEPDAPRGTKTHRQRLLRRAAIYAIFKTHRSAADLTTDELDQVERWVHANFVDDASVLHLGYEILDGDIVRFTQGDRHKDIPPPPADDDAPAAA